MNLQRIINHFITLVLSIITCVFISDIIDINYNYIRKGVFEINTVYWAFVIMFIFLIITASINILFIHYYIRNKDYIVSSTYELYLYEKSLLLLEYFTILYPLTIWISIEIVTSYWVLTRGLNNETIFL